MTENIFEEASRLKLRFETTKGVLSVDDLWDVPLTSKNGVSLDGIARALFRQLKSDDDVSFVEPSRQSDRTVQLKFDIAKHIIDVRLAENRRASEDRARAEKKQKLLEILADKQDESLRKMSVEEIQKAVAEL